MRILESLVLVVSCFAAVYGQDCFSPFMQIGDLCLYVEESETKTWAEARQFCQDLGGDGSNMDLLSTPTCGDFSKLARYMEINHSNNNSKEYWMGGTRVFGESWSWLTLDDLRTGVPFFTWDEGEMPGDDCAALNGQKDYKMECSVCDRSLNFVCGKSNPVPAPRPGPGDKDCKNDEAILIGNECYIFYDQEETWSKAEEHCRSTHENQNGQLFFPQSCEEYTFMAHHLEADEKRVDYWIGAIDTTGNHAWTWTTGAALVGGVPYWAYGEPNHASDGNPSTHCGVMASDKRYYMHDEQCSEKHAYICKIEISE